MTIEIVLLFLNNIYLQTYNMVLMSKYRLNKEPQRKYDHGRDTNTYENVKT